MGERGKFLNGKKLLMKWLAHLARHVPINVRVNYTLFGSSPTGYHHSQKNSIL